MHAHLGTFRIEVTRERPDWYYAPPRTRAAATVA